MLPKRKREDKPKRRRKTREERISRLCSYTLRHNLQQLRDLGVEVGRFGEVDASQLVRLPSFERLATTGDDLRGVDRLHVREHGGRVVVSAIQGTSDPLAEDAQEELAIDEVPEVAYDVGDEKSTSAILEGGASWCDDGAQRPQACSHAGEHRGGA